MRLLLDASVSIQFLLPALLELGHDVVAMEHVDPSATDEQVLARSVAEDRILVTLDKDFGDLVFVEGRPHRGVVRLYQANPQEQAVTLVNLIAGSADTMQEDAFIVVSRNGIRIHRFGA